MRYSANLKLSYKLKSILYTFPLAEELLETQLVDNGNLLKRLIAALVAIAAVILLSSFGMHYYRHSDPYVHSVLSLSGDLDRGRFIYQMNCSSCHGIYADGQVGPSLHHVSDRKSKIGLIHQVTSGKTPPMPQFQPTPQEMADLLKYLESL